MSKSASIRSLKIFIITYLAANFFTHVSNKNSIFQYVSAGSKSSKSGSKTTVIAIDGGGGGKAHPIPVPWPVIHCHHHHHHMKYVPKPVLVHHWVKKIKPSFEIEATDKHELALPMGHHEETQLEHHDTMMQNGLDLHQESWSPSEFAGIKAAPSLQYPAAPFDRLPLTRQSQNLLPTLAKAPQLSILGRDQIERELRRIHNRNINSKVLQSKKLNRLAQSVLLNKFELEKKQKKSGDIDHDDSEKNMAFVSNKTLDQPSSRPEDNILSLIQKPLVYASSDSENTFSPTPALPPGKPSHLFDEPQDQINDESQLHHHSKRDNQVNFYNNLEKANLQEQNQASQAFQGVAAEQVGRLMALHLKNSNQLSFNPSPRRGLPVLNQLQPTQSIQVNAPAKSALLFRPEVSSRVAGSLSELQTIKSMTDLANQIAQAEAKKLLDKQEKRLASNRNATQNKEETRVSTRNLNLLSLFKLPLGHNRDRRRAHQAPQVYVPNLTWPIIRLAQLQANQASASTPLNSVPQPMYIPLNGVKQISQRTNLGQPASSNFMLYPASKSTNDHLSAQASSRVNRLAYPPTNTAAFDKSELKSKTNLFEFKKLPRPSPRNIVQKARMTQLRPERSREESNDLSNEINFATTMSPEQEARFYHGQGDHLRGKKKPQSTEGQQMDKQHIRGPPLESKANNTQLYQSVQPSNVHNLIADPSQTLHANSSIEPQKSTFTGYLSEPLGQQAHEGHLGNFLALQPWEQTHHMRPFHTAQSLNSPIKISHNLMQEGEINTQQQQYPEQLMPLSSYLEFPLSPEQWSAEALRSMNRPSKSDYANLNQDKLKTGESINNEDTIEELQNTNSTKLDELMYDLTDINPQTPQASQNKIVYDHSGPSAEQLQVAPMPLFSQSQPYPLFADQGIPALGLAIRHPMSDYGSLNLNPFVPLQTQPSYSQHLFLERPKPPMSAVYAPNQMSGMMAAGSSFNGLQTAAPMNYMSTAGFSKGGKKALKGGIADDLGATSQLGVGPYGATGGVNQADPAYAANNDMNQLQQMHSSLSQGINQADNITAMARLSQQLRDQMRTLQQRLPSMPNIPNIPQPPQIPNLPMPPPGMMQMAGLALPFAMARATRNANRIRDQRVNSAANGGGTSAGTGQRLLNNAARYLRTRRRPTSTPTSGSSDSNRNRRRFSGVIQTIVDIRRRPPRFGVGTAHRLSGATAALTSAKLKPKVDVVKEVKAKRQARSSSSPRPILQVGTKSSLPGVVIPGSMLATLNDGRLQRFASMTSPLDTLANQVSVRARQSGLQVPYTSSAYFDNMTNKMDMMSSEFPRTSAEFTPNQQAIQNSQHNRGEELLSSFVPLPVVANHINLLLFTAHNITGNLNKKDKENRDPTQALEPIQSTYVESSSKVQHEHHQTSGDNSNSPQTAEDEKQQQFVLQPEPQVKTGESVLAPKGEQAHSVPNREPEDEGNPAEQASDEPDILKTNEPQQSGEDTSYRPEQSMFAPIISPFVAEGFRPLEKNEHTTTTRTPAVSKTTFKPSSSTLASLLSDRNPDKRVQQVHSKHEVKAGKFKRSTDPPVKKAPNVATESLDTRTGGVLKSINRLDPSTTRAIEHTTLTTTTTTRMPLTEVSLPAEASNADYVRAVKLVRGVAYPWPPPTKSSKILDPIEIEDRRM